MQLFDTIKMTIFCLVFIPALISIERIIFLLCTSDLNERSVLYKHMMFNLTTDTCIAKQPGIDSSTQIDHAFRENINLDFAGSRETVQKACRQSELPGTINSSTKVLWLCETRALLHNLLLFPHGIQCGIILYIASYWWPLHDTTSIRVRPTSTESAFHIN